MLLDNDKILYCQIPFSMMTSNNTKSIVEKYKKVEKEKEDKIKKSFEENSSESENEEEESKHYTKCTGRFRSC